MSARVASVVLPWLSLAMSSTSVAAPGDGSAATQPFGVARAIGDACCAAIDAADAKPGERVAVVSPSLPQHLEWATLQTGDAEPQCGALRDEDLSGRLFALRFDRPLPDDVDRVGIVVRGALGFDQRHGRWVAHLPRGDAWFSQCASSEGLHLGAWPTSRWKGAPLWHAYAYLGYDTEPDCTGAQTLDPPGG